MSNCDIKRGMLVRIKTVEEFRAEFRENEEGDFLCPYTFTIGMRKFCGKIFEVIDVMGNLSGTTHTIMLKGNGSGIQEYNISREMVKIIEPIEETEVPEDFEFQSINGFLSKFIH